MIFDQITSKTPIDKGWSGDKKYCVTDSDGIKYLLRISPVEQYDRKKNEFDMMRRVSALGVPMCLPVAFGSCDEGVYSLQSWIDGKDAEEVIPLLPETEQYVMGLKAGEILRKIHCVPVPDTREDWHTTFSNKVSRSIAHYRNCSLRFDGDDEIVGYIYKNIHLLKKRPNSLQHGDYGISNLMYANGEIYAIDFSFSYGDSWQDFESIRWMVAKSTYFATGMVDGYFEKNIPNEFWHLLKIYLAEGCFHNIVWSINTGDQTQIDTTLQQIKEVGEWFDNFQTIVPGWYVKDFYFQYTDGVPYKLKSPFDFSFLDKYGKVFKVFDDQDSGNICFGTEKAGQRSFVKFAGAPTEQYSGKAEDAISRLKATVPVYRELKHPNLIELAAAEEIGGGFALVFKWADGECMGRMYPASRQKFMQSDMKTRLAVFRDILSFFSYIASKGYVAIDFYDGSIMYDFEARKTTICDIDFFKKVPCVNDMGRMWGSSRFMSPEEFTLGTSLDEITNVYTLGATVFALFSGYDRTREAWKPGSNLYAVAKRAVSDKREDRQQSIKNFIHEWQVAINE